MSMGDERVRRLARNEALFREVNETVGRLAATHGTDAHRYEFLCECSDQRCVQLVALSLGEYEAVRAHGDRFAIVAGHEDAEIETVVEKHERFVVVEKVGEGAVIAHQLDPRNPR